MWTKIKWGIRIVLILIVGAFLHYTLPQRDVVQIINTYNKLTEIGANWMFYSIEDMGTGDRNQATSATSASSTRCFPTGKTVMVYRNEDTGWIWPPYFKWDSAAPCRPRRSTTSRTRPTRNGWRSPITAGGWNGCRSIRMRSRSRRSRGRM
jgi:hypothetical protein